MEEKNIFCDFIYQFNDIVSGVFCRIHLQPKIKILFRQSNLELKFKLNDLFTYKTIGTKTFDKINMFSLLLEEKEGIK